MGTYAANGSLNVTLVDGSVFTGVYAANGSLNVAFSDGNGIYNTCGAINITVHDDTSSPIGYYAPDGSRYVTSLTSSVTGATIVTFLTFPWLNANAVWGSEYNGTNQTTSYWLAGFISDLPSNTTDTRSGSAWLSDGTTWTEFPTNTPAQIDGVGLDVEGTFTNKIRNPRGEGGTVGVVGSGGALPTNWSTVTTGGMSREFKGSGIENGLPYTEIRYFGTATGTFVSCNMEAYNNTLGVAAGQAWGMQIGFKLVDATLPPLAAGTSIKEYTAGNVYVADRLGTVPGFGATKVEAVNKIIVNGGTTGSLIPSYYFTFTNGQPYDFTVRIYAPKLVRLLDAAGTAAYLPTYPILPPVGTPGDSTRYADVVTTPTFDWFAAAGLDSGATELVKATFTHVGDGVNRPLFEYSDGTTSNYIRGYVDTADHVTLQIVAGGVTQTTTALTASISAANKAYAFGWSAAGGYVTNGTETVTFGAITLPTGLTQKRIGSSVASNYLNDILREQQGTTLLTQLEAVTWTAAA